MTETAVILTGGKSLRYGRPKGLEKVGDLTLIGKLALELRAAGIDDIYLSTDDHERYEFLGLPIIPDRFKDGGPLAGIHSALLETGTEKLLVLPCDLPGLTSVQIRILLEAAKENPAPVVFVKTPSQEHPLCSVVRSDLLEKLTETLSDGKNAALRFFKDVDHKTVFFEDETPFMNVNTPEDLKVWEADNVV